jgi:hypothetical protein
MPEKFNVTINAYNVYSGTCLESALKKAAGVSEVIESIIVEAVFANQVKIQVPQKYWMHSWKQIKKT